MFSQRIRNRLHLATIFMVVGWVFPSFFSTMSFFAAETPEEARAQGMNLPSDWDAGVRNHGKYYRWWSISDRPFLFACSIGGLATGLASIWMHGIKETRRRREAIESRTVSARGIA
jgi:hypothetical protein